MMGMIRNTIILFILFFSGIVVLREKEALLGWKPSKDMMRDTFIPKNQTTTTTMTTTANSKTNTNTNTHSTIKRKSRRKFISYTSSQWEQLWLDHIDEWAQNKSICSALMQDQLDFVHDFMNITCTNRYEATPAYPGAKWCRIDDTFAPIWYDTESKTNKNGTATATPQPPLLLFRKPIHLTGTVPPHEPVRPTVHDEHIVSKFVFLDEFTGASYIEYIEPLVAVLRHPLSHCFRFPTRFSLSRSYIIPPPQLPPPSSSSSSPSSLSAHYWDAGASSWAAGAGGPSLHYFWEAWQRHGIRFRDVYAYETTTTAREFYATVPPSLATKIHYQQCAVSSDPAIDTRDEPFLPKAIKRILMATNTSNNNGDDGDDSDDKYNYVFFKLDIDSPTVEANNIDYILQDEDNVIDELAWEHHVDGNYLMAGQWGDIISPNVSLWDSYQYFLKLRQKGIRAHSWV